MEHIFCGVTRAGSTILFMKPSSKARTKNKSYVGGTTAGTTGFSYVCLSLSGFSSVCLLVLGGGGGATFRE